MVPAKVMTGLAFSHIFFAFGRMSAPRMEAQRLIPPAVSLGNKIRQSIEESGLGIGRWRQCFLEHPGFQECFDGHVVTQAGTEDD